MPISLFDAPLYRALKEYESKCIYPFHMPGHKMGRGLPRGFGRGLASLDMTEIPGMDNLHQAEGVIRDAQTRAAEAFGSDRTYFLVNGSTCGIYSMISAICRPGDRLITARDCHKSVINGMIQAGVQPVFLTPEFDKRYGISTAVSAEILKDALVKYPDAAGVFITRPNYYGICSDIKNIADIVHSHNRILAVDEAHGAHLKFSEKLPVSALDAGADICVQSAHKTLPALTQCAYLHVKSDRIDIERLEACLSVYQTSSPSYILMASLDVARSIMQKKGRLLLGRLVDVIGERKAAFMNKEVFTFINDTILYKYESDETRISIYVGNTGFTGYEAERLLRDKFNIQVEMSDLYNIVCIATIADPPEAIGNLFNSLDKLAELNGDKKGAAPGTMLDFASDYRQALDYREIINAPSGWVKLECTAGRVSKGIIAPYPPGVPIVCPGEIITPEALEYIRNVLDAGGTVNGIRDGREINVLA